MNRYEVALFEKHITEKCPVGEHDWVAENIRSCPKGVRDCSQKIYKCKWCGLDDDGQQINGPGYNDCRSCLVDYHQNWKCPAKEHAWKADGKQTCPKEYPGCFQITYRCHWCGEHDSGHIDGPTLERCKSRCPNTELFAVVKPCEQFV